MRIIAGVDLVLGPALTLIVYKVGKPSLKFDMSMIALLQLCALAYGVWVAHQQSVVALTFADGRFIVVSAAALSEGDQTMREAGQPIQSLEKFAEYKPAQIYINPPSKDEYQAYIADAISGMPELPEQSWRYLPLKDHYKKIANDQIVLESLDEDQASVKQTLTTYLENLGESRDSVQFYWLQAKYNTGIVVFKPSEQQITDIIY